MASMAITSAAGAQARLRGKRRQPEAAGKGTVPDMEATPGRFHGPKISQRLSAVATKFRPSPPKISFTPPKVFSAPASIAQSGSARHAGDDAGRDDERGMDAAGLQQAEAPTW